MIIDVSDAGQAAPLLVAMLVVTVLAILVTVEVGRLLDESARARTSSDAAALAGAAAGRGEAESLAAANGGTLLSYAEARVAGEPEESEQVLVTVSVRVGRAEHSARAERLVHWESPD